MATPDKTLFGTPCWVDLMTSDVEQARSFYGQVLGVEAGEQNDEFAGYFMFMKDGRPIAGAMANQSEGTAPDLWSVYLSSADANATLARALEHGGSVIVPGMQVGELGTMAVVLDPGGAAIGVWAPIEFAGFGAVGESGTPVWFELHTNDYDRAVDFYRDVFDWETVVMSDTVEFRYTAAQGAGENVAGILDASSAPVEGAPPHWMVYFRVNDLDTALAKVNELGGSVLSGPEDTPYGRVATVADLTGAQSRLMSR
jgi:predicted enzyme related to lactoylglutathione lyase